MSNENIEHSKESRPEWDHLEDWLRARSQGLIQHVLEEEVTEFLGRAKSARRSGRGQRQWLSNGHSLPEADSGIWEDTSEEPRVRDTEERFVSRLLPLFVKRSRQMPVDS